MNTSYTVVINGHTDEPTTGTISSETLDGQHPDNFIGEYVTIKSHDEDGIPCEHYGRLTEILD